jgi:N6-adenosine-specific RNA methylase IME4
MNWPFGGLQPLSYDLIDIDVPWPMTMRSSKGEKKSSVAIYGAMTWPQIKALRVGELASRNCLIRMWCTWPLIWHGGDPARHYEGADAGRSLPGECMREWGFRYVTGGAWFKRTISGKPAFGTGYIFRSSCEPFMVGKIGSPVTTRSVRNAIDDLARGHSRKPELGYQMLEQLMPNARRCTLFAPPEPRHGWDVWGFAHGVYEPVVYLGAAAQARAA